MMNWKWLTVWFVFCRNVLSTMADSAWTVFVDLNFLPTLGLKKKRGGGEKKLSKSKDAEITGTHYLPHKTTLDSANVKMYSNWPRDHVTHR